MTARIIEALVIFGVLYLGVVLVSIVIYWKWK